MADALPTTRDNTEVFQGKTRRGYAIDCAEELRPLKFKQKLFFGLDEARQWSSSGKLPIKIGKICRVFGADGGGGVVAACVRLE